METIEGIRNLLLVALFIDVFCNMGRKGRASAFGLLAGLSAFAALGSWNIGYRGSAPAFAVVAMIFAIRAGDAHTSGDVVRASRGKVAYTLLGRRTRRAIVNVVIGLLLVFHETCGSWIYRLLWPLAG